MGRYSLITPFSRLASLLIRLRAGSGGGGQAPAGQHSLAERSTAAFSQDLRRSWEPEKVLLSPGLIRCTIFCAAVILTGGANLNFCNPQPQTPPTPETVCVFFFPKVFQLCSWESHSIQRKGGRGGVEKKTSVWLCPGDCFYSCNILKSRKKSYFSKPAYPYFSFFISSSVMDIISCPSFLLTTVDKKKKKRRRGKINLRNWLKLDLELHNDLKFSQDLYFGRELFYEWI